MRARRVVLLVACFALGAVLGTLLDGIHAYGDVLEYSDPAFGRWAWFVPLEFGLLGLAVGSAMPLLERLATKSRPPEWPAQTRLLELALFVALYLSTALVPHEAALALAITFAALAAGRLAFFSQPGDLAYVLLACVLGPAAEAALSGLGVFDYRHPDFLGIPYWLPFLWANGGFLIRRLLAPIVLRPAPAPAV
jgi:hypothetical protein